MYPRPRAIVYQNIQKEMEASVQVIVFFFPGPAFWGLINPEWSLCNRGRRQSPVNLEPDKLLFDPNLRSLHIDKHRVSGYIANTGHSVIFTVDNSTRNHINVTGGPLSYRYQFQEMHMHYGLHDDSGSEHSVNDYAFPAEHTASDTERYITGEENSAVGL
ncbi:hypothetical protein RUM43_012279 [Polyplax serrata]|uniref:Alpha-carbonic anhydrase domain-containing protein n=1 Tax=Polyplax serrata TaxID=468196 RepID=A0AAN8P6Y1_POLSC